ncbi:hypothetical protein [Streptomyces sp. NPDC019224]|uniref:hypothetical protein n=1 Tax=Streptomyces sp. NPDC019224 TaxID=3154484 RepID=UPI0033DA44BF
MDTDRDTEQTTTPRREAAIGTAGFLTGILGALAGLAVWLPYGRRGLFGAFEGETNPYVLLLGLPVLVGGGAVAALAAFAAVRGRWRTALGLAAAVAALAAVGYGLDVLAAPQAAQDCGSPC